jgi:putative oxidoreductase
MENAKTYLVPLGRLLMSSLFIWAGFGKLTNPSGTAQYFASYHLPAPDVLVWIVIIIELIGGLLILVGFQTRWVAWCWRCSVSSPASRSTCRQATCRT